MTLAELAELSRQAGEAVRRYQAVWSVWRENAKGQLAEYRSAVGKEAKRLEKLRGTLADIEGQLYGVDKLIDSMVAPPVLTETVGVRLTAEPTDEVIGMPPELRPIAAALSMLAQPQRISGVYFLVRGASVVYVGQSVNVAARVASHTIDKKFDRVFFLETEPDQLLKMEAAFIRMLKPEHNKMVPDPASAVAPVVEELVAKCLEASKLSSPASSPEKPKPEPSEAA